MNDLSIQSVSIAPMSESAIAKVRELESFLMQVPQAEITTDHVIHAGMYARTITIPADMVVTGVLIKIATLLIVSGDVVVYVDGEAVELSGYNVLPAGAYRKQAVVTKSETFITMLFTTQARSVEQAESEFTDEADILVSRRDDSRDTITITGE